MKKVPGFGRKREMLCGMYHHPNASEKPRIACKSKTALVIGAGLAGCHMANILAQQGWVVHLLERHQTVAEEASGNPQGIPHECIIKGDGKFLSIAAASILAKVHRDKVMSNLGQVYPVYKWQKNAGYPTPEHKQIIEQHGITEHHRKTFLSKMKQLKLF